MNSPLTRSTMAFLKNQPPEAAVKPLSNDRISAIGLILLWLLGFSFSALAGTVEAVRYQEQTGDEIGYFSWEIERSNPVVISSREPGKTFTNTCRLDGDTLSWEISGKEGTVRADRRQQELILKGHWNGNNIDKTIPLDSSPWFQALSFSLGASVIQKDRNVEFWMVRPDDFTVHKLKASRIKTEFLSIGGTRVEAHRIRVRLTGAMSMLWHADYWFRTGDLLLVRYEGVHGPPGTPETVISLLPENGP